MSRRPVPTVANDFSEALAYLIKTGAVAKSPSADLVANAKKIHQATHSLIVWRFRLKKLTDHSRMFVEEIASDALQILPQILLGYGKPAKLLTRGIIENVLRHVYFADHPIEFKKMNDHKKWYMTMDSLFEYAKTHPDLADLEAQYDAIAKLSSLYSSLSGGIHGRTVSDLEMRQALSKIKYDDVLARHHVTDVQACAAATNFILAVFHKDQMHRFQQEDKRAILRTMPPSARKLWRNC
jgi:hypothetical protein